MSAPEQTTEVVTSLARLRELQPAWGALVDQSATRNPYARPEWLLPWAERFVPDGRLRVVALWEDGTLVALAPYFLRPWPLRAASLQLLGTSMHVSLTELPEIVCRPGSPRGPLREVMAAVHGLSAEWDWVEVPMAHGQGWFEPGWLGGDGDFVLPKTTRATVPMPLAANWPAFLSGLKRNVRESIRRGYNRLDRLAKEQGLEWSVVVLDKDNDELREGLAELVRLHQSRATTVEKEQHADAFADAGDLGFLLDAAPRMAGAGHLSLLLLRIGDDVAGAQLVLQAADGIYFSVSGLDATWWDYSPVTVLKAEAMRLAIEQGLAVANLSAGPDTAKLRWSETVEMHQEFIVVGGRRRSQLAFLAFWIGSSVARVRRERGRHVKARGARP